MPFKRVADNRDLDDVPCVVPEPAADTPHGRIVDLVLAADEAKRRRLEHPASVNDAQVAESLLSAHRAVVQEQPDVQVIVAPIMDQLQAMNNRLDQLQVMNNRLDGLQDAMTDLFRVVINRLNMLSNLHNVDVVMAFAVNGAAVNYTAPVQPVPRLLDMEVPPGFPQTLGELKNLSREAVDGFLHFYAIPIHGTDQLARHRLFAHLGVRLEL